MGTGSGSGSLQSAGMSAANSSFSVTFKVLELVRFAINTSIGPNSHVNLSGGPGNQAYVDVYSQDTAAAVVETALLNPGQYSFAFTSGSANWMPSTSSDFVLEFVDPAAPKTLARR